METKRVFCRVETEFLSGA